jgi:hypothetical protein
MASGAKDVGILAMDIYFPPNCVLQVPPQSFLPSRSRRPRFAFSIARLPYRRIEISFVLFFLLGFRRLFGPGGVNSSRPHTLCVASLCLRRFYGRLLVLEGWWFR